VTITLFYYFAELRKLEDHFFQLVRIKLISLHCSISEPNLLGFSCVERGEEGEAKKKERRTRKSFLSRFVLLQEQRFSPFPLPLPPHSLTHRLNHLNNPPIPRQKNRNGSLLELNLPRSGLSCDLSDPRALPALAAAAPALASLDLSGNDLTRTRIELVAPALGSLGSLESLDLSASGLRGDLGRACALVFPPENSSSPPSPSSRSRLRSVNLAANEVGGALPSCLVSETPSLQALHLDFNPLVGALPPKFGEGLVLFTAAAPAAIGDDDDASSSRGSSRVGGGGARSGGITGSLPASLPHKMAHLDLSNNRVEGALPASLPESTTQLHLGGNALSGELPAALFSSPSRLRSLRLGSNAFTGPLPDSWAASSALRVLELSGNALSGELPSNWSGAEYLSVLSLADNELEGSLPATLAASRALVVLDVSGNRLSGGLADFANALPVRGERGEDDRGSLLKSFSIARNPGLNEGTLAAAAALSRLGAFAPPSLEPAVKVPGREEAVASASAAFARRRAVGLRGGGGGGAGSSSSSSGSSAGDDGETLVPPALPGIQEPSDAEMIAAASPRVFDAAGCAGLGGPFPAWLVTATAAASSAVAAAARDVLNNARPAVDVRLAGVPLSCPPEGALFSVREQPPRRAFEGLACETMPGKGSSSSGNSVPISSLLRITREKDAAAKVAPTAAMSPDAVELSKARARATAVRVIGVVVSLATVATALALCARSCCGSSHRSRSKASSASSGLGCRFSRWRSNSDGEGGPSGAISSSSADPSASTAAAALRTRPIHKSASASAVVVSACAASPIAGASASLFVGSSSEDKL